MQRPWMKRRYMVFVGPSQGFWLGIVWACSLRRAVNEARRQFEEIATAPRATFKVELTARHLA